MLCIKEDQLQFMYNSINHTWRERKNKDGEPTLNTCVVFLDFILVLRTHIENKTWCQQCDYEKELKMNHLEPPPSLKLQRNKAEDWKKWKQRWANYYKASGLRTKEAEVQTATLLHVIGEEGLEIYNNFVWEAEGDEDDLGTILEKFETYCNPRKNLTIERHAFNTRIQGQGESVDDFLQAIQKQAKNCEFGDLSESLIKDRLVAGMTDNGLRVRLLEKTDLTLEGAVQILKAAESSRAQAKAFVKNTIEDELGIAVVKAKHQVKENKYQKSKRENNERRPMQQKHYEHYEKNERKPSNGIRVTDCGYCGIKHPPRKCMAYGATCFACQGRNHFARMCRTRKTKPRQVEELQQDYNEGDEEQIVFVGEIDIVNMIQKCESDWVETLVINSVPVTFKLDTGAQCNILPKCVFDKVANRPMESTKIRLKSYTCQQLIPIGQVDLWCTRKGTKYKVRFQVVDGNFAAIIGKDDCVNMNIIQRVVSEVKASDVDSNQKEIVHKYSDVFEGRGELPGEYRINLDRKVIPVIHAPRRVPLAYEKELQKELSKMEQEGIIEKVPNNEPADWVSSLVVVTKPNGGLRICLDPKDLNKAIKREHHPLRTVEEVAARVSGAKVFSILDAEKAFYQIALDKKSSKLLTFNTPFGRYRYLRMPMGIKSASEIFQRRAEEVFKGIDGIETSIDDSLVWGVDEKQHDERLIKALERVRENKMKLNLKKCQFKKSCVYFLGNKFTAEGLQPDERHCTAIREMRVPENREAIQRFLGMVNYVSKYIPNMSQLTAPMRELLKKEVVWHWTPELEKCFKELKQVLVNPPVLQYYNPKEELTLQVDASSKGIGACLIQNSKPVAYASKALTTAQQNYSPIEKEMLGILYGCTRFNEYIAGRETIVETDSKPLESIVNKPLHMAPLRLQRMMFQLQRFPGITVKYKKGKEMFFADTLSRAYVNEFLEDMKELEIDLITDLTMSQSKIDELVKSTNEDKTLQELKEQILKGWPEEKSKVPKTIQGYWNYREELSTIDGLIFKGLKVIIPQSLRSEMLKKLHEVHMGIVKSKQRARDSIFWHGINSDIEELVKNCETCQMHQRSNTKEPMIAHEIPDKPWTKVGTDLFTLGGNSYILCVDYTSKFPEMMKLSAVTSREIITALKSFFSRHGIPEEVISDNGPQYASDEFKAFSCEWDFKHTTSSPYYPKSNGQAEKTVDTLKRMLKKVNDPYIALLEYRNTPLEGMGVSPAQILMSRRLRSKIPTARQLLRPEVQEGYWKTLKKRQEEQKKWYDKNAKILPELKEQDNVYFQQGAIWKPAIIKEVLPYRSYVIQAQDGNTYRRNRSHLKRSVLKQPEEVYTYDDDIRNNQREPNVVLRENREPRRRQVQENRQQRQEIQPNPVQRVRTEEHGQLLQNGKVTRSGRVVRRPIRFNL